jgi:hypothetical protein
MPDEHVSKNNMSDLRSSHRTIKTKLSSPEDSPLNHARSKTSLAMGLFLTFRANMRLSTSLAAKLMSSQGARAKSGLLCWSKMLAFIELSASECQQIRASCDGTLIEYTQLKHKFASPDSPANGKRRDSSRYTTVAHAQMSTGKVE